MVRNVVTTEDGEREWNWCQEAGCEEVERGCQGRGGKQHQLNNSD